MAASFCTDLCRILLGCVLIAACYFIFRAWGEAGTAAIIAQLAQVRYLLLPFYQNTPLQLLQRGSLEQMTYIRKPEVFEKGASCVHVCIVPQEKADPSPTGHWVARWAVCCPGWCGGVWPWQPAAPLNSGSPRTGLEGMGMPAGRNTGKLVRQAIKMQLDRRIVMQDRTL